jgi:comEA protein
MPFSNNGVRSFFAWWLRCSLTIFCSCSQTLPTRIPIRRQDQITLGILCGVALVAVVVPLLNWRSLPKESAVFPDYAFFPTRFERAAVRQAQNDGTYRVPLRFETDYEYLVDLNTAGEEELCALPGIGPVLARRILDYRAESGGFYSPEDLMKVKGIGEKKFAKVKVHLKDFRRVRAVGD